VYKDNVNKIEPNIKYFGLSLKIKNMLAIIKDINAPLEFIRKNIVEKGISIRILKSKFSIRSSDKKPYTVYSKIACEGSLVNNLNLLSFK